MWLIVIGAVILIAVAYIAITHYRADDTANRTPKIESEKFSTDMNRYAARKERKASEARTNLAAQLSNEMASVTGMAQTHTLADTVAFNRAANLERLGWSLDIERNRYQTFLDQNNLTRQIIGEASLKNMDVASYLELKKKIELDRVELDKQWREAENQLKAGFIYQLQAHQHLALMTEYIGKLYDRATELKSRGKDREYLLIEEHIQFMEGDFRGRQRLLQATNEENVQGGNENTYAGGDGTETV